MGGLLKKIPITGWTFIIAWLAIAGIPPFAGFFSKDEILWKAISIENPVAPWLPTFYYTLGIITALLTAFYMTRLLVLTFFEEYRGNHTHHNHHNVHHDHHHEIKEYPIMYIPLIILAIFSAVVGFLGVPHALGGHNIIEHFLAPVVSIKEGHNIPHEYEIPLMILSVVIAIVGIVSAFWVFLWKEDISNYFANQYKTFKQLLENKYYVDEIYEAVILKPIRAFADQVAYKIVDFFIIDGFANGLGPFVYGVGNRLKIIHNGKIQTYVLLIYLGFVMLVYLFLFQI
jgi:NADH-quinone oxidoreductase subunit L